MNRRLFGKIIAALPAIPTLAAKLDAGTVAKPSISLRLIGTASYRNLLGSYSLPGASKIAEVLTGGEADPLRMIEFTGRPSKSRAQELVDRMLK